MPPRKRPRGGRQSTQAPRSESPASSVGLADGAVTPTPKTQRRTRRSIVQTAGGGGPSPYRTRHHRPVRGLAEAAKEGLPSDLIPPSDDEEYDEWRAVRAVQRSEYENEAGPSRTTPTPQYGFPTLPVDEEGGAVLRLNTSILSPDSVLSSASRSRQPSRLRLVASPSIPPSPTPNPNRSSSSLPPLSPSPRSSRHFQPLFSSQESLASGSWSSSTLSSASSTPRRTTSQKGKERVTGDNDDEEGTNEQTPTPSTVPLPPSRQRESESDVHQHFQATSSNVSPAHQQTTRTPITLQPDQRERPQHSPRERDHTPSGHTPLKPHSDLPESPPAFHFRSASPSAVVDEKPPSPSSEIREPSPLYRSLSVPQPLDSQDPLDFFDLAPPVDGSVPGSVTDHAVVYKLTALPSERLVETDKPTNVTSDIVNQSNTTSHELESSPRPPPVSPVNQEVGAEASFQNIDYAATGPFETAPNPALIEDVVHPRERVALFPPSLFTAPSQEQASHSERTRPSSPLGASQRSSLLKADLRVPASQRSHRSRQSDGLADPALLQFRFARTFRNRTALQLQPYTREKQMYERALKRGGLAKSKRAIAPLREVKEVSDIDEEEEGASDESSDEDVTPPDAIVIGGTQEQQQQRKPRKERPPVELVDADFDEYILEFGEAPGEDDLVAQRQLQKIARKRLRADREARQQAKRADRQRREFEALLGERRGGDLANRMTTPRQRRGSSKAEEQLGHGKRGPTQSAARQQQRKDLHAQGRHPPKSTAKAKTPRTMTYSRRHRDARAGVISDSESALSDPPEVESRAVDPLRGASPPRELGFDSDAGLPLNQLPARPEESTLPTPHSSMNDVFESSHFDYNDMGAAFFGDVNTPPPASIGGDVESEDDGEPEFRGRSSRSTSAVKRRRLPSSSSQDSDERSSPVPAPRDKRQKIARRMLPGVMLKRLEQEARARQRLAAEEKQRRGRSRTKSPVRPGHAVVRRGAGGGMDEMADLFESSADDDIAPQGVDVTAEEGSEQDSDAERPIEVSSDSSSDGLEAMEDNRTENALARLQQGDFDSIVRGRQTARPRQRDAARHVSRPKKRRRPALGFTSRASVLSSTGRLVQTRLDFPVEEPGSARRKKRASKGSRSAAQRSDTRKAPSRRSDSNRPAIRLDDHVIFATQDFAFESDSDVEVVGEKSPTPRAADPLGRKNRPFQRVQSKTGRRPVQTTLTLPSASPAPAPSRVTKELVDEGVGRARSWANFEKFPIDFDIHPLPSGVFLSCDTIPGSGRLNALIDVLSGQSEDLKPVRTYGVDLHSEMSVEEALTVLPILLDSMYDQLVRHADNVDAPPPDFAPIVFFRDFLAQKPSDVQASISSHFDSFEQRLDSLSVTRSSSKEDKPLLRQLLLARYGLLELAIITNSPNITSTASAVVSLLLAYGLDRTVKPLKRLLRGDSDSPEVKDFTIGVWVALGHALASYDALHQKEDTFVAAIGSAFDQKFRDEAGPLAAERVWFLVFGLCAMSQFNHDGSVDKDYQPTPRWSLVKRALGLIKVTHSLEAEEAAHRDQLLGRDRYIKTMVARCLRLSSTWQWSFDRSSFSVATRDLGMIFKERQQRNLPTEPAADFPAFISGFDFSLTATEDTKHASAFELYLRLAAVAASDLIASAEELAEAHQAEKDVQRLIMSIFPLSAVPFSRERPPTPRQLGALINRYSTMVVACYFSPALLPWLLANSAKWLSFEEADFDSRQVCIRGLMYLAVACRHHGQALDGVVRKLADMLEILQTELNKVKRPTYVQQGFFPRRIEIERTMVLIVSCFRQIILHPGYTPREEPVYPDPTLLHQSWTKRVFELDLAKDVRSGLEIVNTIQAFLDARAAALPKKARKARDLKRAESDDYPSLGFEFDDIDLELLGGIDMGVAEQQVEDPTEKMDAAFANVIMDTICPKIYQLLSDMLALDAEDEQERERERERLVLVGKLTKCWSDCAGIVVVEHGLADWSLYVGSFGAQSWARLSSAYGRIQVGLQFMTTVATADPSAFRSYREEFVSLFFQSITASRISTEHKYLEALLSMPSVSEDVLFRGVIALFSSRPPVPTSPHPHDHPADGSPIIIDDDFTIGASAEGSAPAELEPITRSIFLAHRADALTKVVRNLRLQLEDRDTPSTAKAFAFRCLNELVSSSVMYRGRIVGVIAKEEYALWMRDLASELAWVADRVPSVNTLVGP